MGGGDFLFFNSRVEQCKLETPTIGEKNHNNIFPYTKQ